jgi:large-conductance mechanosensitive channel
MAKNKDSNARRGGSRLEAILILACFGLAIFLAVPIYNSLNFSTFQKEDQDEQNSTETNTSKEVLQEVEPVILQAPEE